MMPNRKTNRKFYFSVEGETEQWYLEHLQELINNTPESKYTVTLIAKKQKNPVKMVKSVTIAGKTIIWHLCDYESDEPNHVRQFEETMDNLKKAKELGKQVSYFLGYSNFAFDLWIVLHKADCNGALAHRSHYLRHINKAYGENFEDMDHYKSKDNFKRCLSKITLNDVKTAINRAKSIMTHNENAGYTLHQYKGYSYYKENPSLEVWKAIEQILEECNL